MRAVFTGIFDIRKSLPVACQRRLTRPGEPAAVLLQAGQHHLVAFVEMCAAITRGVAPAGILPLPLRRGTGGGNQNKGNDEEKSGHVDGPSYLEMRAF